MLKAVSKLFSHANKRTLRLRGREYRKVRALEKGKGQFRQIEQFGRGWGKDEARKKQLCVLISTSVRNSRPNSFLRASTRVESVLFRSTVSNAHALF